MFCFSAVEGWDIFFYFSIFLKYMVVHIKTDVSNKIYYIK